MKSLASALLFVVTALISSLSSAATLTYTGSIINSSGFHGSYPIANAFNQSGLSHNYVSGVTDFATYTAQNPTHIGSSHPSGGALDNTPAFVDLDFGQTLTFTDLALWNDHDYQGINEFSLLVADNASFLNATSLGSFNATYGLNNSYLDYSNPLAMQLFDLNDLSGQFVRINFLSNHNNNNPYVNFGEIVFGADDNLSPVPVPAAAWLFGSALLGFVGFSRKRKVA